MELTGLATTREAIRSEIARYAERSRVAQVEALARLFAEGRLTSDACSPEVLTVLLTSVSRVMILEQALGKTVGHAETAAFVEQWVRRLEGKP
jgi:TetR/AcrR family transcriptional regulator